MCSPWPARPGATRIAVVVGPDAAAVRAFVARRSPQAAIHEQRGAARHGACGACREGRSSPAGFDDVLVLYGDTPLVTAATLSGCGPSSPSGADVAVLGFRPADPAGYGRLIMERRTARGDPRGVKDASPAERAIGFCNAGVMAFSGASGPALLDKIGNDNAAGDYYLTDIVELANAAGKRSRRSRRMPTRCSASTRAWSSPRSSGIFQERRRREVDARRRHADRAGDGLRSATTRCSAAT